MLSDFLKSLSKGLGWGIAAIISFLLFSLVLEVVLSSGIFENVQTYLWRYIIK